MKKTHLEFSFYLNIYPIDIHVCYSDNHDRTEEYFRKKTGEPKLERLGSLESSARTSRYKYDILIEIESDAARHPHHFAAIVAHEAVHATWLIEKALGNLFDSDIQEPQAYLVQFITQYITNKVWNHIRKKNLFQERRKKKK